jgi:hypothetical protein
MITKQKLEEIKLRQKRRLDQKSAEKRAKTDNYSISIVATMTPIVP